MYDRSNLRAAAIAAGAENPNQLAELLELPRNTTWRLWHGLTEPKRHVAAVVEDRLHVPHADLLVPAMESAPAVDGAA